MSRFIDAEPFEEELKADISFFKEVKNRLGALRFGAFLNRVKAQPTADVAPVVHAHWIPKKEMIRSPEAKNYNCSACGKESFYYPNCPFCRAIMDEEVEANG